ncbi:hypothetical protein PFISCL1PPCAC_8047, partial [Pristionchus fissidentatus]
TWNGPMKKQIYSLRRLDRFINQTRSTMTAPKLKLQTEFKPKKVLIVAKTTRYQMEKRLANSEDDDTLHTLLINRGTDYNRLLSKHNEHKAYVKYLEQLLKNRSCETRIVERFDYDDAAAEWADAIFAAGGDGTFLLAGSKILKNDKPVIGINTDPQGSEGHMCLLRKAPMEKVDGAIDRLFRGDFEWLYRTRIRITVTSEGGLEEATPLHSTAMNREPSTSRWEGRGRDRERSRGSPPRKMSLSLERKTEDVPVLSLNEVFVGESLSSRVSYFQLGIDGSPLTKQKNSGLTVCTGSGSTSWYFNINKLTKESVADVLSLAAKETGSPIPPIDPSDALIDRICNQFNEKLMFHPGLNKMAFCVRDPIFNSTFLQSKSRGFATDIKVCSRGYDSHLVVDGGMSYPFNDGSEAHLRVLPEDSLRTVIFR